MSAKLRGTDSVALTFFGDGGANIGTFHEALNIAAVWKAPVVFIIENNLYGEFTPVRDSTPIDDLADRAAGYGIPGRIVDGQDVGAMYSETLTAIERARAGDGPTLIEAKTYRFRGHSKSDPAKYRPEGELERWKERDPISLLGDKLAAAGHLSAEDQQAIWAETQIEVDRAAEQAASAPYPTLEEIEDYVYAS
jgi:pyruvate dehydrogenase E1 component alpha subunit